MKNALEMSIYGIKCVSNFIFKYYIVISYKLTPKELEEYLKNIDKREVPRVYDTVI